MSSLNIVSPNSENIQLGDGGRVINQELNKDMFMQLLVTQLQYQDPLNPMDNQEMMAQVAQFTALEQMKNVADTVNKQLAHSMIGSYVQYTYKNTETGQTELLLGRVDYVKNKGSNTLIGIGSHEVELSDIQEVIDPSNIQANSSAFDLIGKTVQGTMEVKNETGIYENVVIEGRVLEVRMKDGNSYIVVGNGEQAVELELDNVQNIVEVPSITDKWASATIQDKEGNEQELTGIVEYVVVTKSDTYACIDGKYVPFKQINLIKEAK
ncbi:flagellar hook capping protein [Niameybacter massiliensis]|uniref:Basal-body rod modification protein FlgD n=1 Tax=Holtiella tumoricola TaxID=3018743 RepID=A0AA42DPS0_9FIRM|nr:MULTISPECIES: flagellar hook capping FlgD N-terminal domain-containing protein [Lachnospirales]MDA3732591.1 flagellar hook capping protein [Holtiella tumoricola]